MKAIEHLAPEDRCFWLDPPHGFYCDDRGGILYLTDGRVVWRKPNRTSKQAIADSTKDAS